MTWFVTDFADQAVVLPLIVAVAVLLATLGARRATLAWTVALAGTLITMLILKLAVIACGAPLFTATLRSPSGHVAAGTALYGGLALLLLRSRLAAGLCAGLAAVVFAISRIVLHAHTPPEVVAGAVVGLLAVLALHWLLGARTRLDRRRRTLLALAALGVAVAFHGWRLNAEPMVHSVAVDVIARLLHCQPIAAK